MCDSTEEDVSYIFTVAQGLMERAFYSGLIRIVDGKDEHTVRAIAFHKDGSIDLFKGDKDGS